ncbi:MAG TPA: sulfotransferase [Burkholderiales bacterium]|nr:sulfotransferase [Burkholderiales bacterium]
MDRQVTGPCDHNGWIPASAQWRDGELYVDWCHLGSTPLTEPFFEDSVGLAMRMPFNLFLRHQTRIDDLHAWQLESPGLHPTGFIFHMSRCGSTLVAQMLATRPDSVVLSEATPIDAVLRSRGRSHPADEDLTMARLQWLVSALGQRRSGQESHLFIKFDSWHTLDLPLVRKAFPGVPWVFLYRDPVQVLVSQLKQRGAQMVPGMLGPAPRGIDLRTAATMPPEEYSARLLADICGAALQHARESDALLVNYCELPGAVPQAILAHFGINCSDADRAGMLEKARYDAKNPSFEFSPDDQIKRDAASGRVVDAAAQWVQPLYEQLERLRFTAR